MRTLTLLIFLLSGIFLILSSCQSHDKLAAGINTQLDSLNFAVSKAGMQPDKTERLKDDIDAFVKKYPADTMSVKYLGKLGVIYQRQGNYLKAIEAFDRILNEYPHSKQSAIALFMQGAMYNSLMDENKKGSEKYNLYLNKAREKDELYLKNYSTVNPKITSDVQMELASLGKTPDEMFNSFQEKSNGDK